MPRTVRSLSVLLAAAWLTTFAGCNASSHSIVTLNGKTRAKFSNKSVPDVVAVLTKSFGPLKGYTADIPADLQDKRISLEFSDATTAAPVLKALSDATGHEVDIDPVQRKLLFK